VCSRREFKYGWHLDAFVATLMALADAGNEACAVVKR